MLFHRWYRVLLKSERFVLVVHLVQSQNNPTPTDTALDNSPSILNQFFGNRSPAGTTEFATGLSKENLSNVAGQLLFHTTQGLEGAVEKGLADKESRDAVAGFVVGIAFGLAPVPSEAGPIVKSIFNEVKGGAEEEILENITSGDIGVNENGFDEFYELLRESIGKPSSQTSEVDEDLATIRRAIEDGLDGPA